MRNPAAQLSPGRMRQQARQGKASQLLISFTIVYSVQNTALQQAIRTQQGLHRARCLSCTAPRARNVHSMTGGGVNLPKSARIHGFGMVLRPCGWLVSGLTLGFFHAWLNRGCPARASAFAWHPSAGCPWLGTRTFGERTEREEQWRFVIRVDG